MTWLAPGWLAASAVVALAVVGLHLLARRRPPPVPFPTARFIPTIPPRSTTRALRPTDLLLLALRVAIVLLIGAAFARPVVERERRGSARVLVLDRSRAVGSIEELRSAAESRWRDGDVLVLVDSAVKVVRDHGRDSIRSSRSSPARGSLSAGLIAGLREGGMLRQEADTVTLVLISPFAADSWDDATAEVTVAWGGPIETVRLAPARASKARGATVIGAAQDDPLVASLRLEGLDRANDPDAVRIVRGPASPERSASSGGAGMVVEWPRFTAGDTVGALVFDPDRTTVAVGPFVAARGADETGNGTAILWTPSGTPVGWERTRDGGCTRSVAVDFVDRSDAALGTGARALVRYLTQPCGFPRFEPVPDSLVDGLASSRRGVEGPPSGDDRAPARWLFAAAALLAALEPLARRRRASAGDSP